MSFARPTLLNASISLVIILSSNFIVFASSVKTLKRIEVISYEDSEQVHLEFDEDFLKEPKVNFGSDSIRIYLDSVKKDPQLPMPFFLKSDSLIGSIHTFELPETNFLNLDIKLNSSAEVLETYKIKFSGRKLILSFQGRKYKYPKLSSTDTLLKEMGNRVKKDRSFPSTFSKVTKSSLNSSQVNDLSPIQMDDWGDTIITLVFALILILLLIYIIAFLYNRFFRGRFAAMQGKINIRQLSSYHVGPKQKIIVFEIDDRKFACGVTPHSINLIGELFDEDSQENFHSVQNEVESHEKKFSQDLEKFENTIEPEFNETKKSGTILSGKEDDVENLNEFNEKYKGVFIKNDIKKTIKVPHSKEKKDSSINHEKKFKKASIKTEKMAYGNQMMIDFARKLKERIKFLKPIK